MTPWCRMRGCTASGSRRGSVGDRGPTPRLAAGQAVTRLASPAATLLLLAFGPNRMPFVDGVSQAEVEKTFPDWNLTADGIPFYGPSAIEAAQRPGSEGVTYVVGDVFPEWDLMSVDAAQTAGLGWPMKRTSPTWYRLQRRT